MDHTPASIPRRQFSSPPDFIHAFVGERVGALSHGVFMPAATITVNDRAHRMACIAKATRLADELSAPMEPEPDMVSRIRRGV